MKRKACFIALIAAGLFVVMSSSAFATLVDFSFTDDYLVGNWEPDAGEIFPSETFGIIFYALDMPKEFAIEEMSTNVPNWLVFHAGDVALYFGYQGVSENPFVLGNPIILDSGTAAGTDFQFDFTLDPISPQFLAGETIEFPVHLYYKEGNGIAHSEGTMSLTGIPEPATIALLGLSSLFLLRRRK